MRHAIIIAAAMAMVCVPQALIAAPERPPCELEPGPTRTITKVIDTETLGLEDGSEVRLIGALGPRAREAAIANDTAPEGAVSPADTWPPEKDAIAFLKDLAVGRPAKLAFGGEQKDRYGRYMAHVFIPGPTGEIWLQGDMLSAGMARAYAIPRNTACGRKLLAREAHARETKRGLWANPLYRIKPADKPGYLMTLRNRFERVQGTIADVSKTKSALYLNFGNDWKSDFTARVAQSVLSQHPGLEEKLLASKGETVIVRGWIERRNGPLIDIIDPSQLEGLEPLPNAPVSSADPEPEKLSPASHRETPGTDL